MYTLKDAYEEHIESEKFSQIVVKNLENYPKFEDGGIKFVITDFSEYQILCSDNGTLYSYPLHKGEKVIRGIKVFGFDFMVEVNYDVFGGLINLDMLDRPVDEITTKFWLMRDNYVCLYWSMDHYKIVELSEFIKRLKNPIKMIK